MTPRRRVALQKFSSLEEKFTTLCAGDTEARRGGGEENISRESVSGRSRWLILVISAPCLQRSGW
jgi:hypothetical protein